VKIQNVKGMNQGLQPVRETDIHLKNGDGQLHFRRTLTNLSEEVYKTRLHEMKRVIDEHAERIADKVDVKELERYRKLIREFLDEIVSNGYTFSREDAYGSRGRHRFIATVQVIDKKLEELGKELLKEHADKIEIISRLDDIRGLLLDLMM
jgi:uncharacterized protein YaaR (DUF327 family)